MHAHFAIIIEFSIYIIPHNDVSSATTFIELIKTIMPKLHVILQTSSLLSQTDGARRPTHNA